jgi:DedD protein
MSTDARDGRGVPEEGFHEIQLSGKQLVFLFMATTVVSIVIFLCGVLVGRGVRSEAGSGESSGVGSAAAPEAAAPGTGSVLAGGREATPPAPADEPPVAENTSPGNLSYPERLEKAKPPREELKAGTPSPSPGRPAAAETPAGTPSGKTAAGPPPAPLATAAPREGRYVVQVAALRERSEAEVIARRLSSRGYQVYVDASSGAAVRMYRVRVGAFKDRRDADRVRLKLEREEQFKPWVTTR